MFSSFGKAFGTTFGILCGVQAFYTCRKKWREHLAEEDARHMLEEMKEKEAMSQTSDEAAQAA